MRPLRWWAESAPPGGDRVKVSENLGATSVAPVAPMDTSLQSPMDSKKKKSLTFVLRASIFGVLVPDDLCKKGEKLVKLT